MFAFQFNGRVPEVLQNFNEDYIMLMFSWCRYQYIILIYDNVITTGQDFTQK